MSVRQVPTDVSVPGPASYELRREDVLKPSFNVRLLDQLKLAQKREAKFVRRTQSKTPRQRAEQTLPPSQSM